MTLSDDDVGSVSDVAQVEIMDRKGGNLPSNAATSLTRHQFHVAERSIPAETHERFQPVLSGLLRD
jgi:hypothetical protein